MLDSNNIATNIADAFLIATGGNWLILFLLFFGALIVAFIMVRAKASTVLVSMFSLTFLFMIIVNPVMAFFWMILLAALFALVMGIKRWWTSP